MACKLTVDQSVPPENVSTCAGPQFPDIFEKVIFRVVLT